MSPSLVRLATALVFCLPFAGGSTEDEPLPVPQVAEVDLERYMGDWYLIAHIPTSRDGGAHNAQENYSLNEDGSIAITYRNRLGGFDGKHKLMTPRAHVVENSNNALWHVIFGWYWPFHYEYRIAHLEPDYSTVIVARSKRDFLWLFSRAPQMSDEALARYTQIVGTWGYEVDRIERVPQQWPNPVDGSMPVLGGLPESGK
ncbi:MAG: lipocalin family protein [Panacagrimonas sp.]